MSVMIAMLRRHGATMAERHGRLVPAHFGSVAAEEAICRSRAGLAERSDRATLEVTGTREEVDRALEELTRLGDRAWWLRPSPGRAIVRCDGEDEGAAASMMVRAGAEVADRSAAYAAVDLVGPLAEDVLAAAEIHDDEEAVAIVRHHPALIELLVPHSHGPALWNRLLEAGQPHGLACVGLDALDRLAVSEHLTGRRRSQEVA